MVKVRNFQKWSYPCKEQGAVKYGQLEVHDFSKWKVTLCPQCKIFPLADNPTTPPRHILPVKIVSTLALSLMTDTQLVSITTYSF